MQRRSCWSWFGSTQRRKWSFLCVVGGTDPGLSVVPPKDAACRPLCTEGFLAWRWYRYYLGTTAGGGTDRMVGGTVAMGRFAVLSVGFENGLAVVPPLPRYYRPRWYRRKVGSGWFFAELSVRGDFWPGGSTAITSVLPTSEVPTRESVLRLNQRALW